MKLRATWLVLLLGIGAMALGGCERELFPSRVERTPFERYQRLHGKYRPQTETNANGGQQPALRARLQPLDTQ